METGPDLFVQFSGSFVRQISTKSFLFRFERTLGQAFEDLVLGIGNVLKYIQWKEEKGPIFGFEELALSSNMREAKTSRLAFYAENGTNQTFLLRETNTSLHDIEVLAIGGEFAFILKVLLLKYYVCGQAGVMYTCLVSFLIYLSCDLPTNLDGATMSTCLGQRPTQPIYIREEGTGESFSSEISHSRQFSYTGIQNARACPRSERKHFLK